MTTMTLMNQHLLDGYLKQIGATMPAEEFCKVVSHYYHEVESGYYDQVHQEIFEDETSDAWNAGIQAVETCLPEKLRVLDIGCGTGFAAQTVVETLGCDRVQELVCIDPSPHMLSLCKKRLSPCRCDKQFLQAEIAQLLDGKMVFDLIVTNSVLHHVFDLGDFFGNLDQILAPGGVYICGHDPASLHYTIEEMRKWNRYFNRYMRFRRELKPKRIVKRLLVAAGMMEPTEGITDKVNRILLDNHYITAPLAGNALVKMVDIHVPQSSGQFLWGRPGFSPEGILDEYLPGYECLFSTTYHHIKAPYTLLDFFWRNANNRLKKHYPDGGADILMAFSKPQKAERVGVSI